MYGVLQRRHTRRVVVGGVAVGGGAPIVVQSMTNTDTADIEATVAQVAALARAGSELVRITVNSAEAAAAVPHIRDRLAAKGVDVPLVGDFHFNGHRLLTQHPGVRRSARQAAHQSRQRRPRLQTRRAVRDDDRVRVQVCEAGAHRRQLGQPRRRADCAHDGRQRAQRGSAGSGGRDAPGARRVGARQRPTSRKPGTCAAIASSCRAR